MILIAESGKAHNPWDKLLTEESLDAGMNHYFKNYNKKSQEWTSTQLMIIYALSSNCHESSIAANLVKTLGV